MLKEGGLKNIRIDEIARKCGIAKGSFYTKLKLKMYQIWDGFCAVAKLNGGRRSSATLTGMKQRHGVKDAQR